ncbi:unnamed protein product, partial [Prorocentrum cordatum]
MGSQAALRMLAGSLRREPPERTCKVLLETAHFEVRAGTGEAVRDFLRCLTLRLPHQGPVYCDACRVESILGTARSSLAIAERGVQACLKYGPLWFVLLHYAEKAYGACAVRDYASLALQNMSHELHWKVHFETAAAFGREGLYAESRQSVGQAALHCPKHLRWKVWLLAARSELWAGSTGTCRKLLDQARSDAPPRMQVSVCIEEARAQEFLGEPESARAALAEAHVCEGHDWKIFLEHIFMEARQGCLPKAKEVALSGLSLHPATGRLWSALIMLEHSMAGAEGATTALATFHKAVKEVPKSGEVWCEGARVFLNPLAPHFNLALARKCLEFAVYLTPQYGDSFLEWLRLRILLELQARMRTDPLAVGVLGRGARPRHEVSCLERSRRRTIAALVSRRASQAVADELRLGRLDFSATSAADLCHDGSAGEGGGAPSLRLAELEVQCAYADPNYGFLWFWCRQGSLSAPADVLSCMRE